MGPCPFQITHKMFLPRRDPCLAGICTHMGARVIILKIMELGAFQTIYMAEWSKEALVINMEALLAIWMGLNRYNSLRYQGNPETW